MARSFLSSSSQYIEFASDVANNVGTSDFTVSAWYRGTATPPDGSTIFGKRRGPNPGWYIGFDGDSAAPDAELRWRIEPSGKAPQTISPVVSNFLDGNWHLFSADRRSSPSSLFRIWVDGSMIDSDTDDVIGDVDNTEALLIGADGGPSDYTTGEVGPVFIIKRLLTAAEHQMLAAGMSARFLRPLPSFMAELMSRGTTEPDIIAGLTGTRYNSPGIVDNPRLIFPVSGFTSTAPVFETIEAAITGQSAITAQPAVIWSLAAQVDGQGDTTADISANVAPGSTIAGQSAITASVNIDAAVGAEPRAQGSVYATLSADVPLGGTIAGQSALTAAATAAAPVDAQIDGQSALTSTGERIRTLTTTIGAQSALTADTAIIAGVATQTQAQSTVTAAISATMTALATIQGQPGIVAALTADVPVSTTYAGASFATATATRAQPAVTTVAGQSTLTADIAPRAPVETAITAQSDVAVVMSATAPLQTGIDAESDITVRPTYPGTKKTITVGGVVRWLATIGGRITR